MALLKYGFRKSSTANLRKPYILVSNSKTELEALWEKAKGRGLTLKKAADLLERRWLGRWGISTVRDVVLGKGGQARERQLRATLADFLGDAGPANYPTAESVTAPVAISEKAPEYPSSDQDILIAEIKRLKDDIARVEMYASRVVASSKTPGAAQEFLKKRAQRIRDDRSGAGPE